MTLVARLATIAWRSKSSPRASIEEPPPPPHATATSAAHAAAAIVLPAIFAIVVTEVGVVEAVGVAQESAGVEQRLLVVRDGTVAGVGQHRRVAQQLVQHHEVDVADLLARVELQAERERL